MKKLILMPLVLLLTSCAAEPEPKYICTKSHSELKYEYAPKLNTNGTIGYGMKWVPHEICDKKKLNPKYGGAFND